ILKNGGGLISMFSVGNSANVDLGATAQSLAARSRTALDSTPESRDVGPLFVAESSQPRGAVPSRTREPLARSSRLKTRRMLDARNSVESVRRPVASEVMPAHSKPL